MALNLELASPDFNRTRLAPAVWPPIDKANKVQEDAAIMPVQLYYVFTEPVFMTAKPDELNRPGNN